MNSSTWKKENKGAKRLDVLAAWRKPKSPPRRIRPPETSHVRCKRPAPAVAVSEWRRQLRVRRLPEQQFGHPAPPIWP